MAFNDRLKEARLNKGLTQEQVAEKIGIAKSTLTGYEKGNREPNMLNIQKLMEVLSVDANFLWQDEINDSAEMIVSSNEWNFIKKYRNLAECDRELVNCLTERLSLRRKEPNEFMVIQPPLVIPYYGHVASAGSGQYVFDDIPPEMIEIEYEMDNMQVDFAIGVNGDSMEPTYKDGDVLLVKKQSEIHIGEIGIFMINSEAYVKELGKDALISHNSNYDDIKIDESILCLGKVIGKHIS